MPTEQQLSSIPYQAGRAKLEIFQNSTPLIELGLNEQWNYDNWRHDLHIWNTAFGFEPTAEQDYRNNKHRKALSAWLMGEKNVPANTLVLIESLDFSGGYDLG